jgi:hypothetical protein
MDATAFDARALRQPSAANLSTTIRAAATAALCILLTFAALFLFVRRCAGALNEALPTTSLIGLTLSAALAAWAAQFLIRHSTAAQSTSLTNLSRWLPRATLPILALAVSLPGSSPLGLLIMWLTIIAVEVRSWRRRPAQVPHHNLSHAGIATPPKSLVEIKQRTFDEPPAASDWLDQSLAQRMVYRRSDSDENTIVEGWVRANFAAEQRTAIVHVAFCPPFARQPQVEAESLDGPEAEIRPTLVLPWGIRWEIKLATPAAEPLAVVLGFYAAQSESPAPNRSN